MEQKIQSLTDRLQGPDRLLRRRQLHQATEAGREVHRNTRRLRGVFCQLQDAAHGLSARQDCVRLRVARAGYGRTVRRVYFVELLRAPAPCKNVLRHIEPQGAMVSSFEKYA